MRLVTSLILVGLPRFILLLLLPFPTVPLNVGPCRRVLLALWLVLVSRHSR